VLYTSNIFKFFVQKPQPLVLGHGLGDFSHKA